MVDGKNGYNWTTGPVDTTILGDKIIHRGNEGHQTHDLRFPFSNRNN